MPKKIRRIFVIKNQPIVWQRYMGGGGGGGGRERGFKTYSIRDRMCNW